MYRTCLSKKVCMELLYQKKKKKLSPLSQFPQNISAKIFPPFSLPSHISVLHQIEARSGFEVISLQLGLN